MKRSLNGHNIFHILFMNPERPYQIEPPGQSSAEDGRHEEEAQVDERMLMRELIGLMKRGPMARVDDWDTETGRQEVLKEAIAELKEARKFALRGDWTFVNEKGKEEYALASAADFADKLAESFVHPKNHRVLNPQEPLLIPTPGFEHEKLLYADQRSSGLNAAIKEAEKIKKTISRVKGTPWVDLNVEFIGKEGEVIYGVTVRLDADGKSKYAHDGRPTPQVEVAE